MQKEEEKLQKKKKIEKTQIQKNQKLFLKTTHTQNNQNMK